MGWEEGAWEKTIPGLIELMRSCQPGSTNYEYFERILKYKYLEKNERGAKNLIKATWALAIITGTLVLVTGLLVYVTFIK